MCPDRKPLQGRRNTNLHLDFKLRLGDVDAAFAAADHVFEHIFHTRQVMHTPLEPLVSLAESTPSSVTIHTASQMPSVARVFVAALLGWPENRVRIRTAFLGGGFGAKTYIKLEALVRSLRCWCAGRYRAHHGRQFFVITKHANTLRLKSGVTREPSPRHCRWWNGDAYADIGRLTQKSVLPRPGRRHRNVISPYAVTNLPPGCAGSAFPRADLCL